MATMSSHPQIVTIYDAVVVSSRLALVTHYMAGEQQGLAAVLWNAARGAGADDAGIARLFDEESTRRSGNFAKKRQRLSRIFESLKR